MCFDLRAGGGPRQHKSVPEGFLSFNFQIMEVFPLPGKYKSTKSDQQDAVPGWIQAIYACCWLLRTHDESSLGRARRRAMACSHLGLTS